MELNSSSIKNAAKSELQRLSRTSFSSEGFSRSEADAIASAIAAAIKAYDVQRSENSPK